MKLYIVPSSLFVPGRIMEPLLADRELAKLKARKEEYQQEMAALPARIAATDDAIAEQQKRLSAYDQWRMR